jgi:hypothetical protein
VVKLIGKILKVFSDHNLFDEGVELIGSWCFQMYQAHLGAKKFPLRTQDVDFLIPNPFRGKDHPGFIKDLEDLGFHYDFKRDGSLYLWNEELKIEFITPEKGAGADNSSIKVKKLGLNAIPLRFVTMLLDNPVNIADKGVNVLVPNPENFCLHKLIIASRRRKFDKGLKDLEQAICTSVIVDADRIRALFMSLPKKWQRSIINTLEKAGKELAIYSDEIDSLELTLQIPNK